VRPSRDRFDDVLRMDRIDADKIDDKLLKVRYEPLTAS
jgi:hypothetical protein